MTFDLYPVLLKVPTADGVNSPKERGAVLSRLARKALRMSADRAGLVLEYLEKGENGQPLPQNGVYWSLTHKTGWVGAVATRQPVGIDLERIKPIREGMFAKVATESDWDLVGGATEATFFHLWTAKEAVVKAEGIGFAGFSHCRVNGPVEADTLKIFYETRAYTVTFKRFDGHIAAITSTPDFVNWQVSSMP